MGDEGLAYAGMDDAGEMSAWYALNAIGLYTYSPADPEYIVTVPIFDKVTLQLGDKPCTIAKTGNGVKIKEIKVGDRPLEGYMVQHSELADGKTLSIVTE